MTTYLLDANVLISLTVVEHEHHGRAGRWLAGVDRFAVCPVVEGALMRFLVRLGERPATAEAVLRAVAEHPRAVFWPADLSYRDVDLTMVHGHRQVTDAYLVSLAQSHGGALATLDEGLARAHPGAVLVPPAGP